MTAATETESTGSRSPSTVRLPMPLLRRGAITLAGRRNGLNLLRLVFATAVLVAHGWYLAGVGIGPQVNGENMGGWAVIGFFAISGYLITASRLSNPLGTYLVHRIARIFPAFLVCLVVTAVVFAPIGFLAAHGTLDGFLSTTTTPANYVFANAGLRMVAYDVAGTPSGVPFPGSWSGSLWTLYYEFLCYLIVGAFMCLAWMRRSAWGVAASLAVTVALFANIERLLPYFGGNADIRFLLKLLPFFLAGALVRLLRDRIVLSWPFAIVAAGVAAIPILLVDNWGPQLAAPLIAYVVIWLGAVLPCPELIRRNDISYGVYIYAWPVQELFALAGVHKIGLAAYDVIALAGTIPLAIASWVLIERPVMRRARRSTTGPQESGRLANTRTR